MANPGKPDMPCEAREFLLLKLRDYVPAAGSDDEILGLRVAAAGLDSLDLMELLNEIEEAFDIRVEDDTVTADTTVAQVVEFIERKVARRRD